MKKVTFIASLASLGAVAAVLWTVPASAASTDCSAGCTTHDAQDRFPGRYERTGGDDDDSAPTASVPEPGTLALLALGLSGLGITGLSRKRTKK
jgi:PEP-CTERM motif